MAVEQRTQERLRMAGQCLERAAKAEDLPTFQEQFDAALGNLGSAIYEQRLSGSFRKEASTLIHLKKYLTTTTATADQAWAGARERKA